MNYTKPQVAVLGQAVCVIEQVPNKLGHTYDGIPAQLDPAYDLDE
jgi:hypothetical protein